MATSWTRDSLDKSSFAAYSRFGGVAPIELQPVDVLPQRSFMIASRRTYDDPTMHRMQGFCVLLVLGGIFVIGLLVWQSHLLGQAVNAERISIDQLTAQDSELRERSRQAGVEPASE